MQETRQERISDNITGYFMNNRFPALFVSHGAPTVIIDDCPARDFYKDFGKKIGKPKGIISVTAHWTTRIPAISMHPQPSMIYDFGGFPDELYAITYPAPGDPALAKQVEFLLKENGIESEKDMSRGYDHGTWVPLKLMYPDADIPIVQLSVQPHQGAEHHLAMGKALQLLRDEGVLIVASGSATHNLRDFFGRNLNAEPLAYALDFADWLKDAVVNNHTDDLLDYVNKGPHALRNHPTPEHFLPLFVALGAGDEEEGRVIHDSFTYGAISMAAFAWQ